MVETYIFADFGEEKELDEMEGEKKMPRYINEDYIYNLFDKTGVARLHCVQIDELPRADVQEVRHGKWISEIVKIPDWRGKEQSYYQPNSCSICHTGLRERMNFCPTCGALMDGKE